MNQLASRAVNSLWIGDELSRLELLTLRSFVYHGHQFHLWLYEHPREVPPGVTIRDANEILPEARIFRRSSDIPGLTTGQGSLGPFSDIFRFKLLYDQGGWWVDMDMTCLRPMDFRDQYVFRPHNEIGVMGNVMKCPQGSEVMRASFEEAGASVNGDTIDWLAAQRILSKNVQAYGLTQFVRSLCNVDIWEEILPYIYMNLPLSPDWQIFHWCNERWQGEKIDKNSPIKGSSVEKLMRFYDV
jgi:hypothetical protein